MTSMNHWQDAWELQEDVCPCDVHFNEWLERRSMRGKTIYHFGTGTHHVVGRRQASNGSNNVVFAITASKPEHQAYVEWASDNPRLSKAYLAYFGDIYLTNPALLPEFDVISMFHLCEFFLPNTAHADYGGLTDRQLLDAMTSRLKPGGYMLFYERSFAAEGAAPVIRDWARTNPVKRGERFKTLLVYRKRPMASVELPVQNGAHATAARRPWYRALFGN